MESARRYFLGSLPWHSVIDESQLALLRGDPVQSGDYVIRFRTDRKYLSTALAPPRRTRQSSPQAVGLSINNQRPLTLIR